MSTASTKLLLVSLHRFVYYVLSSRISLLQHYKLSNQLIKYVFNVYELKELKFANAMLILIAISLLFLRENTCIFKPVLIPKWKFGNCSNVNPGIKYTFCEQLILSHKQ